MKIEEQLEKEITRDNCKTCIKNNKGICDVTEEKIGSGEEYCELEDLKCLECGKKFSKGIFGYCENCVKEFEKK